MKLLYLQKVNNKNLVATLFPGEIRNSVVIIMSK